MDPSERRLVYTLICEDACYQGSADATHEPPPDWLMGQLGDPCPDCGLALIVEMSLESPGSGRNA